MKRPIINQLDRDIIRNYPEAASASFIKLEIARLHLAREIDRQFDKLLSNIASVFSKLKNK